MDRVAVLVVGMHRSGTSAVTRMLASLGCDLPKTLMPSNEYNVPGYWESEEVAGLNDALLASAGTSWDDWETVNPDWYGSPVVAGFRSRALNVLEGEFEESRLFVLKDPRIARLLPFWMDVLTEFGADTRIAVPVRNPLEVARSLQTRDAIDPSVGLLLWLRHVLEAEGGSRDRPRAFVRFEDLLGGWRDVAEAMARDMRLSWPRQSTAVRVEIEERLEPSARHHVADDAAVLDSPEVSAWVASTFEIVDRWARGVARKSDHAVLDATRSAFDEAGTAFARAVVTGMRAGQRSRGLEKEVAALQDIVADREGQIDSLNRAVVDRDDNVARLDGVVRAKDGELDKLGAALSDRDKEVDALQHVVADRDGRLGAIERQLVDRDREVDALQHVVAGREGEITALNDAAADRDGRLGELGQRLADRDREVDALQHEVAGREGEIKSLNDAVSDRDRQLEELGHRLADGDREIDALQHVVAGRDGEIKSLNDAVTDREAQLADRDRAIDGLQGAAAGYAGEIKALKDAVARRDVQIEDLDRQMVDRHRRMADRNQEVDALRGVVAGRDEAISALNDVVSDRDDQLRTLNAELENRRHELATLKRTVEERDSLRETAEDRQTQIEALDAVIDQRDRELAGVYGSSSWWLTKPLRLAKELLLAWSGVLSRGFAKAGRASMRVGWKLVPLRPSARERLRRKAVDSFPSLGSLARSVEHASSSGTYVASGWLDLADLNYEARRNGTDLPILFDPDWYLASHSDIRVAAIEPLSHYLQHGAVEGRWPVDLDPEEVDPTIQSLHRLDLAADAAHAFDPGFCRVLYPELAALNDAELAAVCANGERVASKAAFVRQLCENPREIPLDFDASVYIELYPDLRFLADQSPLEALRHYMCHGRFEPRLHTLRTDPVEALPGETADKGPTGPSTKSGPSLCVLAHVYYPELWDELAGYLGNLPGDSYDLYVNLVDDTFNPGLLGRIRDTFPEARIYISENIGRDVGGHFHLLRNVRLADYPIYCLVHTKKSPHMSPGEAQRWRRKLLGPLMGSRETAAENIRALVEDETIGQLGSAACRYTEMNANRAKYNLLLDRMGVGEIGADPEFVSGTMMFLRSEVLARVFEAAADVTLDRSEQEVGHDQDGAWEHAVERVFGAVVRDMRYRLEWR